MMMKRWVGLPAEQLGGGIFGSVDEALALKGVTVGAAISNPSGNNCQIALLMAAIAPLMAAIGADRCDWRAIQH